MQIFGKAKLFFFESYIDLYEVIGFWHIFLLEPFFGKNVHLMFAAVTLTIFSG